MRAQIRTHMGPKALPLRSSRSALARRPGSLAAIGILSGLVKLLATNEIEHRQAGSGRMVVLSGQGVKAMGVYNDRVLPRMLNAAGSNKRLDPLRRRVCEGLAGDVIEIGFGAGRNVPFYPAAVTSVAAIEPSDLSWNLAGERLRGTNVSVQRSGLDGQVLPFADDSFDTALSTWTLCTIPDVAAALRELRRVLKPGGTLHFLEHGLAPDERVRRWQRRLDPVQNRIAGGCHFTRPVVDLLKTAGFTIKELDVFYEEGTSKIAGADSLGSALSP